MGNNSSTPPMEGFIQALYGVVIGVGSLDVFSGTNPADTISYFKVFFVFGTLVIGAHDWFSYHTTTHKRKRTDFIVYIPQIGSLFFLGLMVKAASQTDLIKWYLWGLGYTVFNIAGLFNLVDISKEFFIKGIKYIIHLLLCAVSLEYLLHYHIIDAIPNSYTEPLEWYLFGTTMAIVILLWLISPELNKETHE